MKNREPRFEYHASTIGEAIELATRYLNLDLNAKGYATHQSRAGVVIQLDKNWKLVYNAKQEIGQVYLM